MSFKEFFITQEIQPRPDESDTFATVKSFTTQCRLDTSRHKLSGKIETFGRQRNEYSYNFDARGHLTRVPFIVYPSPRRPGGDSRVACEKRGFRCARAARPPASCGLFTDGYPVEEYAYNSSGQRISSLERYPAAPKPRPLTLAEELWPDETMGEAFIRAKREEE